MMNKTIFFIITLIFPLIFFPVWANQSHQSVSIVTTADMLKLFGSLLSIIGLVLIFSFFFKKLNNFSIHSNKIKIISSHALGTKEKLVIIEVGEEKLLLGVTPGGINYLKQVDIASEEPKEHRSNFSESLKAYMKKDQG